MLLRTVTPMHMSSLCPSVRLGAQSSCRSTWRSRCWSAVLRDTDAYCMACDGQNPECADCGARPSGSAAGAWLQRRPAGPVLGAFGHQWHLQHHQHHQHQRHRCDRSGASLPAPTCLPPPLGPLLSKWGQRVSPGSHLLAFATAWMSSPLSRTGRKGRGAAVNALPNCLARGLTDTCDPFPLCDVSIRDQPHSPQCWVLLSRSRLQTQFHPQDDEDLT